MQVPLLRVMRVEGGECIKSKERDLEFEKKKKSQLAREQMRSIHGRRLSPKLWVYLVMGTAGTNLHSREITYVVLLTGEPPWHCFAPTHPLGINAETRAKDGILFKHKCSWHRHRHYQAG